MYLWSSKSTLDSLRSVFNVFRRKPSLGALEKGSTRYRDAQTKGLKRHFTFSNAELFKPGPELPFYVSGRVLLKFRLLYRFLYPLNDETGHDSLSISDY